VDPFDGLFRDGAIWTPSAGALLDIPAARRWFETIAWSMTNDLYTFQQTVVNRGGPRVRVNGRSMLQMSSYDYLGLLGHPAIEEAAARAVHEFGTATGGVRLLAGTSHLHLQLERELAAFKGTPAAITFSSGYAASLGLITALFGRNDLVLADARAHRSLMDGCRLAGVTLRTFRHNDLDSLRARLRARPASRRTLIVVEGLYSMDGDLCPLPELVELKREYGAFLLVDEAHSFGVLGNGGKGVNEHYGLPAECVDIWLGSLSKAVPSNGGFIAGSRELVFYLQHGAAPFMFSSALCPAAVAAALQTLRVLDASQALRERLRGNAQILREGLLALGYDTGASASAIVPVYTGNDESACRLARALYSEGILASAVVYPAVPRGQPRLRLCATAAQDAGDLEEVLEAFRAIRGRIPGC
jgi:8-amino-7-oxononanoate synthase